MENIVEPQEKKNTLKFVGKGSQLFAIDLVNTVLTIITLGFYYPWAKARRLKYVYQHSDLAGSKFDFLGTGKEIFRGFIKAVLILIPVYVFLLLFSIYVGQIAENEILLGAFIALLVIIILVGMPLFIAYAIFGTFRYRTARSSWRGILCGFDAKRSDFIKSYLKAFYFLFLTYAVMMGLMVGATFLQKYNGGDTGSLVFGLVAMTLMLPLSILLTYAVAWYRNKLYAITLGNLRLGDLRLRYTGKATTLFGIMILGGILTSMTLGIYYFWYKKNLYNFLIANLHLDQKETPYSLSSTITAGKVFRLEIGNLLLLIFTLGLAYSWVYCRVARFIANNVVLPEEINVDAIKQTETNYNANATGEELFSIMDIGGIFF
ncbi:MAG: DUF898 family protein [Paludibacteraceae bacterium]|nr:DUF898 family protein [Paludibacteraceae bacterium]